MRIHYIQHEPFEDLGCIRQWLNNDSFVVTFTHVWQAAIYPDANQIDFLIIMGGSMSAYDDALLPWLSLEKDFIKNCIDSDKKILGICLGSQLLASVLGAKVYPGKEKEIGWFPVQMSEEAKTSSLFSAFPLQFTTMHWHGDTYDLPQGAIRLASSTLTQNQAFIYKDIVIGLQFHPEMTREAIEGMIYETGELLKNTFVQTNVELRNGYQFINDNNILLTNMLDRLLTL